jgi:hypothetical protein
MSTRVVFVMATMTNGAAAGDLAFLIHFVGDIHQPLHTTTNADRGGTCQQVNFAPAEENLHYAWDEAVVVVLEKKLGTPDPEATARKLKALYQAGDDHRSSGHGVQSWTSSSRGGEGGIRKSGRER